MSKAFNNAMTDSVTCFPMKWILFLNDFTYVIFSGVKYTARINEPIITITAEDPDLEENGTLVYMVAASNLYKFGASVSSGSVVPSPFNISQDGKCYE